MSLLIHYSESGHNSRTIEALAVDYHEDFIAAGMKTAEEASASIRMARRRCEYWPKSVQIIKCFQELKAHRKNKASLMIDQETSWHDPTPEEVVVNKKRLRILSQVICREISPEEGEELQRELLDKK